MTDDCCGDDPCEWIFDPILSGSIEECDPLPMSEPCCCDPYPDDHRPLVDQITITIDGRLVEGLWKDVFVPAMQNALRDGADWPDAMRSACETANSADPAGPFCCR